MRPGGPSENGARFRYERNDSISAGGQLPQPASRGVRCTTVRGSSCSIAERISAKGSLTMVGDLVQRGAIGAITFDFGNRIWSA